MRGKGEGEETKLFTRSDFKAKTGVGPDGSTLAGGVSDYLDAVSASAPAAALAKAPTPAKQDAVMSAHMTGTVAPMVEVQDEAFSTCVLGEGAAIEPSEGKLYAPADVVVDNLFDIHHAIGLVTDDGVDLLLHIGINTVELGGKHFEAHVAVDQKVKKGDLLISFDMEAVKAARYLLTTPMIVCNTDDYQSVTPKAEGKSRLELLCWKSFRFAIRTT